MRGAVPGVMAKEEQTKKGLHLELKRFYCPNSDEDQKEKKGGVFTSICHCFSDQIQW